MLGSRKPEDIPADLQSLIRFGTVVSVDPGVARCVVRYGDPDDDEPGETPPIRWLTARSGQTRTWSPPSIGEQVLLLAPDGQIGAAIALTGIVQDAFPPVGNSAAELIEFKDGARLTYDPDASALTAILPAGGTAEIEASGGIVLRGDVTIEGNLQTNGNAAITGDVSVDQDVTAAGDVTADGVSLKDHTHGQVSSGSGVSGPPL